MFPADEMPSTSERRVPVRLRADLEFVAIPRGSQTAYLVKDPVSLKYLEFDEHEAALLKKLDGEMEWDDLRRWFNRRFPPLNLSHAALQNMVWRLHQQGLLVSSATGQGRQLAERARQARWQELLRRIAQPWAIRLPGIHPGLWLASVTRLFSWLFSAWFVISACAGLVVLAAFAISRQEALIAMGPTSEEFLSRRNVMLLAIVIAATKLLHELGHAAAARRQGCECHELGVLLLAGMPSLYCDVSDAWMLPNRWQRIQVSLAGIWVELLIAATSFVIWMTSVPGVVHAVAFNVMAVCSIGTLLFNANPLVRYDGYYVLMDLTAVSNLAQRAGAELTRCCQRALWGIADERPLDAPELPKWCLGYGVASAVYRVFLTFAIVWGLHLALKPFGASAVVWIVAGIGLIAWGVSLMKTTARRFRIARMTGTSPWRMACGMIALVGLCGAVLALPLPWYLFGDAVMEPADRRAVLAAVPGKFRQRHSEGTAVNAADKLAQLENEDIAQEIQQLEHEHRLQVEQLRALKARRNDDVRVAKEIPGAQSAIRTIEHRLHYLQEEEQRLELRALQTGVVYSVPPKFAANSERDLPTWTGTLLDPINRDAWVDMGDAVCQTGTVHQLEAVAVLAQDEMEFVKVGQHTDVYLKSCGRTIRGEVSGISRLEVDDAADPAIVRLLPMPIDPRHPQALHEKWYQVQIRCLEPCPEGTRVRTHSRVRIRVGSRTVGEWLALQFFRTFRWHA